MPTTLTYTDLIYGENWAPQNVVNPITSSMERGVVWDTSRKAFYGAQDNLGEVSSVYNSLAPAGLLPSAFLMRRGGDHQDFNTSTIVEQIGGGAEGNYDVRGAVLCRADCVFDISFNSVITENFSTSGVRGPVAVVEANSAYYATYNDGFREFSFPNGAVRDTITGITTLAGILYGTPYLYGVDITSGVLYAIDPETNRADVSSAIAIGNAINQAGFDWEGRVFWVTWSGDPATVEKELGYVAASGSLVMHFKNSRVTSLTVECATIQEGLGFASGYLGNTWGHYGLDFAPQSPTDVWSVITGTTPFVVVGENEASSGGYYMEVICGNVASAGSSRFYCETTYANVAGSIEAFYKPSWELEIGTDYYVDYTRGWLWSMGEERLRDNQPVLSHYTYPGQTRRVYHQNPQFTVGSLVLHSSSLAHREMATMVQDGGTKLAAILHDIEGNLIHNGVLQLQVSNYNSAEVNTTAGGLISVLVTTPAWGTEKVGITNKGGVAWINYAGPSSPAYSNTVDFISARANRE